MTGRWCWQAELREDGLWVPPVQRWATWLLPWLFVAPYVYKYRGDAWMLWLAMAFASLWGLSLYTSRVGRRPLFGIVGQPPALVAGRERLALARIDRVVVHGPLARREVTAYLKDGMPVALLAGWPAQHRAGVERWLAERQARLPFGVAIESPESPFLQPDTLI